MAFLHWLSSHSVRLFRTWADYSNPYSHHYSNTRSSLLAFEHLQYLDSFVRLLQMVYLSAVSNSCQGRTVDLHSAHSLSNLNPNDCSGKFGAFYLACSFSYLFKLRHYFHLVWHSYLCFYLFSSVDFGQGLRLFDLPFIWGGHHDPVLAFESLIEYACHSLQPCLYFKSVVLPAGKSVDCHTCWYVVLLGWSLATW